MDLIKKIIFNNNFIYDIILHMKKSYIKMNDNNNYLSLGNVINIIKKVSSNKNAMQVEVFSCIFGINNVSVTMVNNYCIGYRPIGIEYKKIYKDLKEGNRESYLPIILQLISILDDKVYVLNNESLNIINNNIKLKEVNDELIKIAYNDEHINEELINNIKNNDSFNTIIELLNYAILENIQPVYTQDINIKINREELNDYLKVKLYFGESYINSLTNLSKKGNMYANAELGALEFDGLISGKKDYEKSYNYYLEAANKNHPKGCWMVANLMLTKRVKFNYDIMWKYLNKSIELGSIAGYNTLGICYLKGINKDNKKDIELAKKYFLKASEHGYAYAFNNLGKIYENEAKEELAIKYYLVSADLNESWALNKVGEYYRKKGDLKRAYIYYSKSIECPISERYKYSYYNLAKYYYENGCPELNIEKNVNKAKEYYKIFESKE